MTTMRYASKMVAALALAAVTVAGPALAGEQAGIIKTTNGFAEIERGDATIPASIGAAVYVDDVLSTGDDGAVGVALRDNTVLSLGPNSEMGLSEFSFDSQTLDGSVETALNAGTLSMLSGEIVKQNPGAIKINTPMAVLSVRGTKFAVEVQPGG